MEKDIDELMNSLENDIIKLRLQNKCFGLGYLENEDEKTLDLVRNILNKSYSMCEMIIKKLEEM